MAGLYLPASLALNTGTPAQSLAFPSIAPAGLASQGTPYSGVAPVAASNQAIAAAGHASVTIANPSGSGQTITAGALVFSDVLGSITASVSYALTSPSIAPGSAQTFYFALSSGLLANVKLTATFGANPGAGTLSAIVVLLPF